MTTNIFLTGATGYIGGDVLHQIYSQKVDLPVSFSLLVRSQEKADGILKSYPDVRTIIGSLDDSDLLTREASRADIVIHTADSSDHAGAAEAIAKGLIEGHTASSPGYWLHTGGAGILTYFDSSSKSYGEDTDRVFDDYDRVQELTNLPAEAFHRNVDEIVLRTGTQHADSVKTVIICPPTIYGAGRGPGSSRSRQVYELTKFILEEKYAPVIGAGKTRWNNVHVHDLAALFELLTKAALDPAHKDDPEIWGEKGYFLAENGEHVWSEVSKAIGQEAFKQGKLTDAPETKALSYDEAVETPAGFEAASWGLNSRGVASRARKVLGWKPAAPSLVDEIPGIVKSEAERLGI